MSSADNGMLARAAVTATDVSRWTWDAVVIGAGPAGCTAACQLARSGLEVLLVERKALPRSKVCGGCVSARAWELLQRGGMDIVMRTLPRIALSEFRLRAGGGELRLSLPRGAAISRSEFDFALAREAVAAGARLLTRTRAVVGPVEKDTRLVQLTPDGERCTGSPCGQPVHVRARVVLAADGLGHPSLHRVAGFESRPDPSSHLGGSCVVRDYPAVYEPGAIYMAAGRGGYVGLVVSPGGMLNIAAAVSPHVVRQCAGLAVPVARILAQSGWPPVGAVCSASWQGTPALTRRSGSLSAQNLFVLGDAAGYPEPFTGEGIAWAVATGVLVAPLAAIAVRQWRPELQHRWSAVYARSIGQRQWVCRLLAGGLRIPWLTAGVVKAASVMPKLANPVMKRLNASYPVPPTSAVLSE